MSELTAFLRTSGIAYLWAVFTMAWVYYAAGYAALQLIVLGGIPLEDSLAVGWRTLLDIAAPPAVGLLAIMPLALLEWSITLLRRRSIATRTR